MTRRVDVVFFDAGSGHRSAAAALVKAIAAERPDWQVRAVDVLDVLRGNRSFHWIVQRGIRWFNDELKREKVFDLRGKVNLSLLFHDFVSGRGLREIARFWSEAPPDAVVSVTPMYNPVLYRAARLVNPHVACVTIPVDYEEFKKRYWFTPRVPQHYLNASERLFQQAVVKGIPEALNHRISGMPADPSLYDAPAIDRSIGRARLGLDPDLPTLTAHFGGQGCQILEPIAKALANDGFRGNAIFLCGRSDDVAERIRALETPYRKAVLGYTPETPIHHLRLADVVVGKPGALTITEALIARRPLVLVESTGMKPVQRGNERWVTGHGVGLVVRGAAGVPQGVREVLSNLSFREAVEAQQHRGVFDASQAVVTLVETGRLQRALLPAA